VVAPEAESRMLKTIRHEILASDERLPLLALKTMREHLDSSVDIWVVRTGAHVLETFGGVALFLAVIGLYALNCYTVARRTREIGIRMALGADNASTLRMILGEALKVTLVGLGVGLLLAIGLGQVLAGFLFDLRGFDPLVLGAAPALLAMVALFACYIPARRAARVDPMIALRYE
jgi:ABC-type antimicrobial peptide transport system permease subunit